MKKNKVGRGKTQRITSQNNGYDQNKVKPYLSMNDNIYRHNTSVIKRTEKKIG